MKNILVTNDDGVLAPGLLALAQEMRHLGKVTILAPDRNWSGGGHVKTLDRALRVREFRLEDGSQGFGSDGAPSDCVALATLGYFKEKFDFVVSGINVGANLGHDVTYSGTVTAAMEAVIAGVPGVAVSLEVPEGYVETVDFQPAACAARIAVQNVIANGLPAETLLNVNVPFLKAEEIRGFRITRQGLRVYHSRLDERVDPRGRPYYWIGGDAPTGVSESGTDVGALADGYVSVTPLQLDLTAYRAISDLNTWNWQSQPFELSLLAPSSVAAENKRRRFFSFLGLPRRSAAWRHCSPDMAGSLFLTSRRLARKLVFPINLRDGDNDVYLPPSQIKGHHHMPNGLELLLAGLAALAAGAVNALAGGGTLITFPALTFLGIPAVAANVTNTVALCPGYFGGTLAQKNDLRGQSHRLWTVIPAGIVGGLLGGFLLLQTGEKLFKELVPYLILLASGLLAMQDTVRAWLTKRLSEHHKGRLERWTWLVTGLGSIYGGYFGAGLGVILIAALGLTIEDTLTRLNALKQAISLATNLTAAIFFLFSGQVVWSVALVMAVGALIGGTLGGKLAGRIKPSTLRWTVVTIGVIVSVIYFVRG